MTATNQDLNSALARWFLRLFLIKVAQHVFTAWLARKVRAANGG